MYPGPVQTRLDESRKTTTFLLKLNAREKTLGAGEKLEDFETHFRIRLLKFHEAPHIVGQLYRVPHGIL
jgi:hypothetical protein